MSDTKIYHIYLKSENIYQNLSEEEFKSTWSTLNQLTQLLGSKYKVSDLSYEELVISKKLIIESSY